jgi:predicted transcriptional regulator
METESTSTLPEVTEEQSNLAEILKKWENACKNCNPLTPIVCQTTCNIWKSKNEFRKLYEKMKNPVFMVNLLNSLKNKRRIQILKIVSKSRCSITRLQQELKKLGYNHSKKTIAEEYINPLVDVGLVDEVQNQYRATIFGTKLDKLLKDFYDLESILPPHSECYEEIALNMLLSEPKTFEDLKHVIPAKSVARVLGRLQKAELAETTKEKDYVFFFRTKRDSKKGKFSLTEKRVYESIPLEGVSARKLAENVGISLRRTYKYLRKLKGKKMVFSRERPKSYILTAKGAQLSTLLHGICVIVAETSETAAQLVRDKESHDLLMADASQVKHGKKEKEIVPLLIIHCVKENYRENLR